MRWLLVLAITFVFGTAATKAQTHERPRAKSSVIQLGDKVITIPNPEGFEEVTSQFKALKERFAAIEPPMNDLLLVHLPEAVCNSLRHGEKLQLNQFTKVDVLKALRERAAFSSDISDAGIEFRKNGPALLDPEGPLARSVMANANKGLSAVESKKIDIELSETRLLGEVDVRTDVYTFIMYIVYKKDAAGTQQTTPMLASLTFLRVKHRMLYVTAYQTFSSTEVVKTELKPRFETLKQFTAKWVNEILAANPDGE